MAREQRGETCEEAFSFSRTETHAADSHAGVVVPKQEYTQNTTREINLRKAEKVSPDLCLQMTTNEKERKRSERCRREINCRH